MLLLGVDDRSREVIGIPVERLDAVETLVREACEPSIKPSLAPLIERLTLPDPLGQERAVLRDDVTRSLFVHQSPAVFCIGPARPSGPCRRTIWPGSSNSAAKRT